jgi:hypothetical protein
MSRSPSTLTIMNKQTALASGDCFHIWFFTAHW